MDKKKIQALLRARDTEPQAVETERAITAIQVAIGVRLAHDPARATTGGLIQATDGVEIAADTRGIRVTTGGQTTLIPWGSVLAVHK